MHTIFSEFSREIQPIWRPIGEGQTPLRADSSKFQTHFPSLYGQPAQREADDLAANSRADDLCGFTAGALIACPEGGRLVEDLKVGDVVETMDHGPQPIRWIGMKSQAAVGDLAPIRFPADVFGAHQALHVGPHQRMHLAMPMMDLLFGFSEALAPAKYLVNGATVTQNDGGEIEYFQLLFDEHEIIWANGVATESLFLDEPEGSATSSGGLSLDGLSGIGYLFPDLADSQPQQGQAARPVLEGFEARLAMSYSKSSSDMVLSN